MMKIAVTGAYGQLGAELCRLLGLDALPLEVDTLDLTNAPAVRETLLRLQPKVVINAAAYTQVDRAEKEVEACRAINATAVEHLAGVCGELGCPLVQISTDYVFAGPPDRHQPYREVDPPLPQGVYAQSKFAGEQAAARHAKHLIVRTCGLYARPSDARAGNFVKTMLRLGRGGSELRVVADQHCTPSYVPHVARAVLFLAGVTGPGPAPWGIYHVTNRGATTWYEFAAEIFRQAGIDVPLRPITTAEYGAAAPRPNYSVLDTTAYHALGGPQMPDWKSALAEYIQEEKAEAGSQRGTSLPPIN
jgi:dTDP-4-dehydrorhamnose reductase